jgi:aerobic-type carbon monoxide dehydrogenase small subunit (CoxS/CutS family)
MAKKMEEVSFSLNGKLTIVSVERGEVLLDTLRKLELFSVKSGCREGDCGMCTVLLNGKPVRSCQTKTVDVESKTVFTVEGLQQGDQVHPIQQAFMETGAIQCGFCTPAQILTAKALLDENPNPSEMDVRNALSGVYCRCTGYVKIIEAVMRAAAIMRGEKVEPVGYVDLTLPEDA